MGMKLKSGADLCGFELSRFCVQNDVAIPDAPASGRKYFHTGTGMEGKYSLLGRERIYTGTSWRAAAYVDDLANLDITSNADFLALKTKVDAFLEGDVDSDGVLENLKEIQKFLDNYSSATDLTDILNTKFDKTGGKISGKGLRPLIVETDANAIETQYKTVDGIKIYLGWLEAEGVFLQEGVSAHYLGILPNGIPYFHDGTKHTLLHEGNANKTDVPWAASNILFPKGTSATWNVHTTDAYKGITVLNAVQAKPEGAPDHYAVGLSVSGYYGFTLASLAASDYLLYRRTNDSDWRTIAFMDSTVGAAKKLVTDNGGGLVHFDSNVLYVGDTIYPNYQTHILGYDVVLRSGASATQGLILNSSGNVTIGASDLAGTSAKLLVDGDVALRVDAYGGSGNIVYRSLSFLGAIDKRGGLIRCGINDAYGQFRSLEFGSYDNPSMMTINSSGNVTIGSNDLAGTDAKLYVDGKLYAGNYFSLLNGKRWIFGAGVITGEEKDFVFSDATSYAIHMLIDSETSSVGIGLRTPQAQLHVAKDIIANGTIACKGVAAEGSAPVGTVDKWAGSIATGTKSQTYTHGLGTTDITVAIYEKNGNEWVQILTDVDIVNANTIRVTFGANTTVEHRIVVMG